MSVSPKLVSRMLRERYHQVAEVALVELFAQYPQIQQRYGTSGRQQCRQDILDTLQALAIAIEVENHALFRDYVAWAKVLLASRGVVAEEAAMYLQVVQSVLHRLLPQEARDLACSYVDMACELYPQLLVEVPTPLDHNAPFGALASAYLQALLQGERQGASRLILDAVAQGTSVRDVYLRVFEPTQYEIGRLWQLNAITVAQEHYCSAATQLIMSQLYPYIFSEHHNGRTLVACCVSSELHEIGVRMLADFFEMEGWDTYYLGANTPIDDIVKIVAERQAHVLGISATISYHVSAVEELVTAVRTSEACQDVTVLVGGYPFNLIDDLWEKVGAHGSARNAAEALQLATQLTSGSG